MRRTLALTVSVTAFSCLLSSPALAVPITVDYIDNGGREWASLVDTVGLTWNQLNTACSQDGATACTTDIGAVETTGWIWATKQQVVDLLSAFGVPNGGAPPASQVDSTWAPAVLGAFAATNNQFGGPQILGLTSTLDQGFVPVGNVIDREQGSLDVAGYSTTGTSTGDSRVGVFLFRPAAPAAVPEPASMILLGTGLAGLAVRRYRTRK